eukprot:scaffold5502_cov390-Prasinococcus_capsulatus_cf.AAC.3
MVPVPRGPFHRGPLPVSVELVWQVVYALAGKERQGEDAHEHSNGVLFAADKKRVSDDELYEGQASVLAIRAVERSGTYEDRGSHLGEVKVGELVDAAVVGEDR